MIQIPRNKKEKRKQKRSIVKQVEESSQPKAKLQKIGNEKRGLHLCSVRVKELPLLQLSTTEGTTRVKGGVREDIKINDRNGLFSLS